MELFANTLQPVETNQNIMFTDTAISGCQTIIHSAGSGLVTLRGLTNQNRARFKISFGANVGLATGTTLTPIEFAISLNGEPIASTTMITTPAATLEYQNIFGETFVDVPRGCCSRVSITNIGTTAANVLNANIIIERVA